jgi:3-hydroxy-9,10-secoandrosta-1,3,5(10)-triene-9,17-dione monooxygenase reductase component
MSHASEVVGHVPAGSDPVEYDRLRRRVLWSLPTGLYVLGSRSGDKRNFMTCNLAMQLALEPKVVGVSVERSAVTWRLVDEAGSFALSLVPRSERAIVRKFVKPSEHDPAAGTLAGEPYEDAPVTGAPVLSSGAGYLDCRVIGRLDLKSHTLFAGEVMAAGFGGSAGGAEGVAVLRMEDTRMNYGG